VITEKDTLPVKGNPVRLTQEQIRDIEESEISRPFMGFYEDGVLIDESSIMESIGRKSRHQAAQLRNSKKSEDANIKNYYDGVVKVD